ncbi:Solute carrier family 25 member 51-like, partial [Homarus americanus]
GLSVVEQDHSSGLPPSLGAVLPKQSADKPAFTMPDPASTSQALARVTPLADDGREFVCGWGAAFINITVTFPMNKLMFRQNTHCIFPLQMLHGISTASAVKQLKREGLKNLYRGILPPLCQKTISTSIMFGMFDQYGKLLKYYQPQLSDDMMRQAVEHQCRSTHESVWVVRVVYVLPLVCVVVLLLPECYRLIVNSIHTTREMWKFGVKEYYRGMVSILLRNGPSNILFFGLRTEVKTRLPDPGRSWWGHILSDFVSGAFLGAFISTVMYPINVIKAHQQTQVSLQ